MDACLECKVNYMDTANYEPEDIEDPEWKAIYDKRCKEEGFSAYFDYSWQWAYKKKFEDAGITALLGSGFDPGVTQAYCAYALKHEFDEIDTYMIVGSTEADPDNGKISNESPVGLAIMGQSVGSVVDVVVGDNIIQYQIMEIKQ